MVQGPPNQRLHVRHLTRYRYHRPVRFGEHRLMVRPRDSHDLRLLDASLRINVPCELRWMHDVFGNSVAVADFNEASDVLEFESSIVIDRYPLQRGPLAIEAFAQTLPFSYPLSEIPDLGRTIERHYADPERKVTEWTRRFLAPVGGVIETETFLLSLTEAIRNEMRYETRYDPGVQTAVETLERQAGSCRDYAVLMMEAVRSVGLAARFVSGYLYDPAIDGGPSDITGAGATHAWMEIYLPGAGWVEFDPTNGSAGGRNLVRVAVAREPAQAMPISGSYEGSSTDFADLEVSVEVRALDPASQHQAA
ncbi:MAG: transglutaminase family protein [Pseudomonadota bacterium]